jgi:N-glycosylase/DNA lyase
MIRPLTLEMAVSRLCPQIEAEQLRAGSAALSECALWRSITLCILSSQVTYEMAAGACRQLRTSQLLPPFVRVGRFDLYENGLRAALSVPLHVSGTWRRYRFPNAKAHQIASTWHRINGTGRTLRQIVYSGLPSHAIRNELLSIVCGFGPKQASMFLRDCGVDPELAIIDRHVLKYMEALRLIRTCDAQKLTPSAYWQIEAKFAEYADFLGHSVGCVDRAVWFVMRVAQRGLPPCA